MSDVFISYSRKDKEFVHILHDALEKTQKNTWVDWEDILPTSEWWQEIESAIAGSDTFIFVITPTSIASEYCNKEVEYAYNLHKRILPIVRQDITDIKQVHPALSRHQWIFFRESDDFDRAFQKLLEAITLDLEHIHFHTRFLVREIEWENNGREESFLLRGKELESAETWLSKSVDKDPKPKESQGTYIEISRKMEDAKQKAIKTLRIGMLIGFIAGALGIGGMIVASYRIEMSNKELKGIQQKVLDLDNYFTKQNTNLTIKYQNMITANNGAYSKTKEELQKKYSQERDRLQEELAACKPIATTEQQTNNKIIYIQVPSEAVKTKTQALPNTLTKLGYKAFKAEVVGLTISPNDSQIRYFFDDKKSNERALKLKQQLNDLGYKEFEVKYVKGFEDKVKPEMMEIWFGKDTK
jgi:hypothetical protein